MINSASFSHDTIFYHFVNGFVLLPIEMTGRDIDVQIRFKLFGQRIFSENWINFWGLME
jgi:hypothetical protein